MKQPLGLLPAALLCCAGLAHAQLYKSVGPDGRVTYSDTPPAAAKQLETRPLPSAVPAASLPYELAQVAKAQPVTLYTAEKCAPCEAARGFLAARGVPYTEKTVSSNEDIAALRLAGGDAQLPLLTIGRGKEKGFEEGAWHAALSAAGYPKASQLPANWRNPAPQGAAPRSAPKAAQSTEPVEKPPAASAPANPGLPSEAPPATGKAPPGFRF